MKLVTNRKQARIYIKEETNKVDGSLGFGTHPVVHKHNLKRKYPCFISIFTIDNTGCRGDVDVFVSFYPLTNEIKRKVVESLL